MFLIRVCSKFPFGKGNVNPPIQFKLADIAKSKIPPNLQHLDENCNATLISPCLPLCQ